MSSGDVVVPRGKRLTDAERQALQQKLDKDLDDFIEKMAERKKSESPRSFDLEKWTKEVEQHPAFLTSLEPDADGEYSEAIQALQALKYEDEGEDEADRQENAERFKKEGNKHFENSKYRWAIDCYTNGIKEKCGDAHLNAVLYFNRAACHKRIGNLRSAFKNCAIGRKFDPTHLKGIYRGANCLSELGYPKDALDWIHSSRVQFAAVKEIEQQGKITESEQKQLNELNALQEAVEKEVEVEERDHRKRRAQEKKELERTKALLSALESRNLNLKPRVPFKNPELMDDSLIEVSLAQLHEHQKVYFGEDGKLVWPLLIQYPEVGQVDVLTDCSEATPIGSLIRKVLEVPAEWDPEHKFNAENIRMLVSDQFDEFLTEVSEWSEIGTVLQTPGYQIRQGLPVVMIYTKPYAAENLVTDENGKFYFK
ncbi:hypothetical protein WR25_07789 [Diploscapter pachys]|uniref:Cns1/TTC4 wheel domain-containing protein n=1 Tax=Diploscapter pachys TaxID=2018661 RepID=A0A2A2JPT1_9BILA|nr:hypothetical protein WR25_07789 [Diploscapter pachys]